VSLTAHETECEDSALRLELLSKGSNTISAGRGKASLAAKSENPWRGKFDRRKRPRADDGMIELTPQNSSGASDNK